MHSYIPIIYICYGLIQNYVHINIELAARYNDVIVLTSNLIDNINYYSKDESSGTSKVKFENISLYMKSATQFRPNYKHMVL